MAAVVARCPLIFDDWIKLNDSSTPSPERIPTPQVPADSDRIIRIATRESPLAMWQARYVASRLKEHGVATELVPLVSKGDTDLRPIDGTRQVGLFTKRIQQALVDDEADVAVHSLKDLPTQVDERFSLAAVPVRETVRDSLVSVDGVSLDDLPQGAIVGTGSTRRIAQLRSIRSDLEVLPIRGNVQTRLAKLRGGEFDAIVLAEAGVVRLEMHDLPRVPFSLKQMLPAPGQGALGIEVRSDDEFAFAALSKLDDRPTRLAVIAERTVLAELHGGCLAPIAALGTIEQTPDSETTELSLTAVVLSPDGSRRLQEQARCRVDLNTATAEVASAESLGGRVAEALRSDGAGELIAAAR
ncbi:porphobilinogen deaminase [Rhodopirellula sallentina SM41]|uniref:Porphobilinogen deaminase n=1 Tax=Rhodopirellula sallentina SM41 TaxID=1263870 RepID=M5U3G2_9BACT|nr:porphobilinogen deaminase [Rhodopirellula sallentina SM41]